MSLSKDFLDDYQRFMEEKLIMLPPTLPYARQNYYFMPDNNNQVRVAIAPKGKTQIPGYYARANYNSNNVYELPNDGHRYMFTDLLTGCQFIAYGSDRNNVKVEHNNWFGKTEKYAERLRYIQSKRYNYIFHISAGTATNMPNTYNIQHGAMVVGFFDEIYGWEFSVRTPNSPSNVTVYGPY